MAFSDQLRKLAVAVGLYGKDADVSYDDHGGGYHNGYRGGYDDGYDAGDDGDYDNGYGEAYDPGYTQPDPAYGSEYPQTQFENETRYQPGYGATNVYARAGARPRPAPSQPQQRAQAPQARQRADDMPRSGRSRPNNVIPMRERDEHASYAAEPAAFRAQRPNQPQTTVFCARRLEDSEKIIDYLVGGMAVVLNLETLDDILFRRVLDMVSGAAFAINASVFPTSHRVYLIASAGSVYIDEQHESDPRDPREPADGYRAKW